MSSTIIKDRIRREIKRGLATLLRKTGAIERRCKKGGVIILMLHKVDVKYDPLPLTVSPAVFNDMLSEIKNHNFEIVSLDSLFDDEKNFIGSESLKFVITFDDGYRNNYDLAFPILQKHNTTATIYLSYGHLQGDYSFWYEKLAGCLENAQTENIDLTDIGSTLFSLRSVKEREEAITKLNLWLKQFNNADRLKKLEIILSRLHKRDAIPDVSPMLTWEMVQEMQNAGISFGSHTISHPILSNEDSHSIQHEVMMSKKLIEEKIGRSVTGFAYPNGTRNDYNEMVLKYVSKAGYLHATTTIPGINYSDENPFQLKRINIHTGMCTDESGMFHPDLFWAKVTTLI